MSWFNLIGSYHSSEWNLYFMLDYLTVRLTYDSWLKLIVMTHDSWLRTTGFTGLHLWCEMRYVTVVLMLFIYFHNRAFVSSPGSLGFGSRGFRMRAGQSGPALAAPAVIQFGVSGFLPLPSKMQPLQPLRSPRVPTRASEGHGGTTAVVRLVTWEVGAVPFNWLG